MEYLPICLQFIAPVEMSPRRVQLKTGAKLLLQLLLSLRFEGCGNRIPQGKIPPGILMNNLGIVDHDADTMLMFPNR